MQSFLVKLGLYFFISILDKGKVKMLIRGWSAHISVVDVTRGEMPK